MLLITERYIPSTTLPSKSNMWSTIFSKEKHLVSTWGQLKRPSTVPMKSMVTMMEVLSNATASLQVPSTIFNDDAQNVTQRLSYSVFTTDMLFQSEETASGDLTVGSIIVGVKVAPRDGNTTQRTTDNNTTMLEEEIVLTFQKNVSHTLYYLPLLLHNYLHVYSLC